MSKDKMYTKDDIIELLNYIKKQPIEVEHHFSVSAGRCNVYGGSWKFRYLEDILKKADIS